MNKSEQAQAITTFTKEERALYDSAVTCTQTELSEGSALLIDRAEELRDMLSNVLGLVDSQAQKIAELEKEITVAKNVATAFATKCAEKEQKLAQLTKERDEQTAAAYRLGVDGQEKIAEQANEIERLKQRIQYEYDAKAGF